MNKKIYRSTVGLAICAFLLNSCYPHGADYVEDLDVVTTYPKKDYNFTQNHTYTLPTRIPIVRNTQPVVGDTLPAVIAQPLLAKVRENMANLGYTEIKPGNPTVPDVAITTYAIETTFIGVFYPYWWEYWGYYPWDSWGYPWGPGWYPCCAYAYSYEAGTYLMNMSSPKGVEGEVNTVWIGAVKGLLEGTTSNVERTVDGIDQAFVQSPYLETN